MVLLRPALELAVPERPSTTHASPQHQVIFGIQFLPKALGIGFKSKLQASYKLAISYILRSNLEVYNAL